MEKSIIEEIHSSFNSAFDNADKEIDSSLEKLLSEEERIVSSDFTQLEKHFQNSTTIKVITNNRILKSTTSSKIEEIKKFKRKLDEIGVKYPYKIISYGQIVEILNKYDLYIGSSSKYIEDIPKSNMEQLKYYLEKIDKEVCLCYGEKLPISSQDGQEISKNRYSNYNEYHNPTLYICAPNTAFDKKNRTVIGREFIYDTFLKPKFKMLANPIIKDPIVLNPLNIEGEIAKSLKLFHVVTAWGPESMEGNVFNQQMN